MAERYVGIAFDYSRSSKHALDWAFKHMIKAGDHVYIVIVTKSSSSDVHRWETSGSPLVPLMEFQDACNARKYGLTPLEYEFHSFLKAECPNLVVGVKVYLGDAREKICDAVSDLRLNCIVMGSRGRGTLKRAVLGSVSNYVVHNAACSVTVVKLPSESLIYHA